jgi:large subunit ribosomal protein L23
MNYSSVLIKPLITEKTVAMTAEGKYTFLISPLANKEDVKNVIKKVFGFDVLAVRIIRFRNQRRRLNYVNPRKGKAQKKSVAYKKAIIQLGADDKLDYFNID